MHISFWITTLTLSLPRLFAIGFTLHNSLPAPSDAAISGPLSRSIEHQRAPHNVMKMVEEADAQQMMMIHRYESPFFPINEDHDRNGAPSSALIILNTPINNSPNRKKDAAVALPCEQNIGTTLSGVLGALWKKSTYRVCADGGANRLYEATVVEEDGEGVNDSTRCCDDFLPNLITGDLDSLYPHVHEYYKSKGVEIVRVEDQDFHDLDVRMLYLVYSSLVHSYSCS